MRWIPVYCDACGRSGLVLAAAIESGGTRCLECGQHARSVPGASYVDEDRSLFSELATALREAGVTPSQAARMAEEVRSAPLEPRSGRGLQRLARSLPSLAVLEVLVDREPVTLRKAEGMLTTLLDALASGRSQSGLVPVPQPSVQAQAQAKPGSALAKG